MIISCRDKYRMSGTINNVVGNGNHMNDNNTTTPSSSLLVDVGAVAVALPGVQYSMWYGMYTVPSTLLDYKSPYCILFCNRVAIRMCHYFPFSLPLFILVSVGYRVLHSI